MRALVVGMSNSPHVARYLELLGDSGWEVHLFESQLSADPHPGLPQVPLHLPEPGEVLATRVERLAAVLAELRPSLIHSHELTFGGTVVDELRRRDGGLPAPWLVTNWGSDIFRWGRDPRYVPRLRSVVGACDYYGAECHRDVALARAFGLRGRVVGVWPVAGGIDLAHAARLRAPGPPSARRTIALKGVTHLYGRGEAALAAVARCADLLDGWELCGFQMDPGLDERAATLARETGMRYTRVSLGGARQSTHDEVLAAFGRSRVAIGLNRTDGLSTSFLEAVALGAFPVQGTGSCGHEITPSGRGALFVDPLDEDAVAAALRRALTDDALVDSASDVNLRAAAEHLDRRRTRARVLDAYERIAGDAWLAEAAA